MRKRKKLPKSIRKYIRQEKARLRRQILDLEEQRKEIEKIYQKLERKKEEVASPPPKIPDKNLSAAPIQPKKPGLAKKKIK